MGREIKRVLKIVVLFCVLFIVNILVFVVLSRIGYDIQMTELSYLFPPLFSTSFLLVIDKIKRNKNKN
ncbi:MAG: hypothetical protein Q4Q17_04540 [Tissierellia bacterium]|nr:hypothetical protein [Tissierellia bacterium]